MLSMLHCLLLPLILLLLLWLGGPADACSAGTVKEIQTKIVEGKLAAIRCSDIKHILRGGSLLDPAIYVECVPGDSDWGCTGGADCRGFRCDCPNGLVYISSLGCTDVDECALHDYQACVGSQELLTCVNFQGGFACNCTQPGQQYHPQWGCTDSPECIFPFVYKGRQYSSCTSAGRGYLWCGVTADVDRDNRWVTCPLKYGKTHCVFPTRYGGEMRSGCFVDKATGRRLCATTNNFDADRESELCMEVV